MKILMFFIFIKLTYGIVIEPPILKIELDKPVARNIRIYNNEKVVKRYYIDVMEDDRYENYSLKDSIKVFPRVVSLSPGEERILRVRVAKDRVSQGEYKGYLLIRESPTKKPINTSEVGEVRIDVNIFNWFSIYGVSGRVDRGVDIRGRIDENNLISEVVSIGNAGSGIWAKVYIKDENKNIRIDEIPVVRIMRGESKSITNKISLKPKEKIEKVIYYETIDDKELYRM